MSEVLPKDKKTQLRIVLSSILHSLVLRSLLRIRKSFEVQCNVQVLKCTQLSSLSLIKYKMCLSWKKRKRSANNSSIYMWDSHVFVRWMTVEHTRLFRLLLLSGPPCSESAVSRGSAQGKGRRGGVQALSGRVFDLGCLCVTGDTGESGNPPPPWSSQHLGSPETLDPGKQLWQRRTHGYSEARQRGLKIPAPGKQTTDSKYFIVLV